MTLIHHKTDSNRWIYHLEIDAHDILAAEATEREGEPITNTLLVASMLAPTVAEKLDALAKLAGRVEQVQGAKA